MNADRTIPDDWHPGRVPENVRLGPSAYIQTSYSFQRFRSRRPDALEIGEAASIYLGVMFDMGPDARLSIGAYSLLNGARIICDSQIIIGPYSLISWNVVLMDSYRFSFEPEERRKQLERAAVAMPDSASCARPIHIGSNVWIGFDSCVLPGVRIGDGSVVGARSVVNQDVPPYTVVAGNPARVIRSLARDDAQSGRGLPHSKTLPRDFKADRHGEAFGVRQSSGAFGPNVDLTTDDSRSGGEL